MCNLPGGETLQIIAKRYEGGAGSNALAALRPGDGLVLEGPFGACTLTARPGRKIFIAGGTGISPILSLIRQAAHEAIDFEAPVDVLYCARRPIDLAAGDDLAEAVAGVKGARYRPYVEQNADDRKLAAGRATDAVDALDFVAQETDVYVAGPPVMVNAVKELLKQRGVPITRIHYDSFG